MRYRRSVSLPVTLLCVLTWLLSGCTWLSANQPPVAAIEATPPSGRAPLIVQLSAAASSDDGMITGYRWEFPEHEDDLDSGMHAERRFDRSGEYVVRLTVTDDAGLSSSSELILIVENRPPIASCRFSNDAPVRQESVLFDASSAYDTDGDLVDFIWDFGDGSSRRGTRVSHTYSSIGLYVVQLTVVDNAGASNTIVHTMTVHEGSSGGGCGG